MSAPIDPVVIAALRRVGVAFARKVTDDEIDVFAEALEEIPPFDVVRACKAIATHERYFPRPATIRAWVDKLRRQATQPKPISYNTPTTIIDRDTGERVELWTCNVCQDKGRYPATEHNAPLSWDAVRGIGEWAGNPIRHHHVMRCTTCNKFAEPTKPVSRRSHDDERDDRRR